MTRAGAVALAGASGLVMVAAFPPYDLWLLGWVAPALLLLSLRGASVRQGVARGLVAGLVFQSLFGWWLLPAGVNLAAYGAGALVCASYLGVFGAGAVWLERWAPRAAPLGVPCLWGVLEWLRASAGWLAAPWGVLGYSQWTVPPVAAVGALAGVWGVSFVLVGAGLLAADGVRALGGPPLASGRGRARFALALALAGLLLAGAVHARRAAVGEGPTLRVALVQAGRHVPGRDGPAEAQRVFERYRSLTLAAARESPALIVWPEASMPVSPLADRGAARALSDLAREVHVHLLVASSGRDKSKLRRGEERWANSVFLLAPDGEIVSRYDKVRLLPFNEYVPLRGLVPWPAWIASEMTDAEPGAARTLFTVNGARFGSLICWENLFGPEFRRTAAQGVDFMVSVTNEAFTQLGPGRHQLFAVNAFRAIENGVPLARAATTGVSAFVSPDGRVVGRVADAAGHDLDVEGFRVHDIPLATRATPYQRLGDWIVLAEAAILVAMIGLLRPRPA